MAGNETRSWPRAGRIASVGLTVSKHIPLFIQFQICVTASFPIGKPLEKIKLINCCPPTQKSLVKGERFIWFVRRAWDTWVDDSAALQITSYVLDAIAKCIKFHEIQNI